MSLDQRIRDRENAVFATYGLKPEEKIIDVPQAGTKVRVLSVGTGRDLVLLHGVTMAAAVWAPLAVELTGYRLHLVDLPGHGLAAPCDYRPDTVREQSVEMLQGLFTGLGLDEAAVMGHSLGGMFALWHAADRPGRIASLLLVGEPAAAFPDLRVPMPLALLRRRVLGPAILLIPSDRRTYRRLLKQGFGGHDADGASTDMVDLLRFAARRRHNALSVGRVEHAIIGRGSRPRPQAILADDQLRRIGARVVFCWGADDPYVSPAQARPWAEKIRGSVFEEIPGGHSPWLADPRGCAETFAKHFSAAGFPPA